MVRASRPRDPWLRLQVGKLRPQLLPQHRARATISVMLSVPPPASASSSRSSQTCWANVVELSPVRFIKDVFGQPIAAEEDDVARIDIEPGDRRRALADRRSSWRACARAGFPGLCMTHDARSTISCAMVWSRVV